MRRRGNPVDAHDVYRVFNDAGQLLYVGCSVNAFKRVPQHKAEHQPWWDEASYVDIDRYPSKLIARGVEAAAIATEAPVWNVAREDLALRKVGDIIPVPMESDYGIDLAFIQGSGR